MKDKFDREPLVHFPPSYGRKGNSLDSPDSSTFVPRMKARKDTHNESGKINLFTKKNLTCGIFFIQGLSLVFVWNALVNSAGFFSSKLQSNSYSLVITEVLFSIFTITRCAFFFLSSAIVDRVSPHVQVLLSNLICCLIFVVFSLISVAEDLPEGIFIVSSMALVFLASVFSVFLYTGNYAILSTLPKPFSQSISLGQGTAGMVTCIAKLITIKVFQEQADDLQTGFVHKTSTDSDSFLYFFFTALLLFFSSLSFFFYMRYSSSIFRPKSYQVIDKKDAKYLHKGPYVSPDPFDLAINSSKSRDKCSLAELYSILSSKNSKIRCLWWCNFIVCFQTMFLFPSWPQMTKSTDPNYSDPVNGQFFTVFILLLFNFGDWLGRIILSFPSLFIRMDRLLFLVSLFRFIHVPLYLFGNVDFGRRHSNPLPQLLASDYMVMANTLLFGLSSGYLTTLFLIEAPDRVSNNLLKIRVSFYMLLGLVLSVALGSIASLALKIMLLSYGSNK